MTWRVTLVPALKKTDFEYVAKELEVYFLKKVCTEESKFKHFYYFIRTFLSETGLCGFFFLTWECMGRENATAATATVVLIPA